MHDKDYLYLLHAGVSFLRYINKCAIVTTEIGLDGPYAISRPDIFGIDKKRSTYEVEIKKSRTDFRREGRKRKNAPKTRWQERRANAAHKPAYFYYLVPEEIADYVQKNLPNEKVGLIVVYPDGFVQERRTAKKNKEFERPTVKQMVLMTYGITATMARILKKTVDKELRFG